MSFGNDQAASGTSLWGNAETPMVKVPRGKPQAAREAQQHLKFIDTNSLRSGSGSRTDAIVENEALAELVASIASVGIIEPVVVRQVGAGEFVIVAGERRVAAARKLKMRQVPCVVTECTDSEALVISLTENLQRSDLDPMEKARALRRLLDEFTLTQQEIGKRVGMSQSAIAHHLRLLSLPQEVKQLISDGALSVGHGKVLASITNEYDAIDAARECVSKNRSVREFETAVAMARGKDDKRLPRGSVRNMREEHELRNGLFLVIKESRAEKGSGTIEIPYYSLDEKNWVLRALSEQETKRKAQAAAKPATGGVQLRPTAWRAANGVTRS